jgi:hypothetical protein
LIVRNADLVRLCPSLVGAPPSRIFKAQLFNALIEMGYPMKDQEFEKLWDKSVEQEELSLLFITSD